MPSSYLQAPWIEIEAKHKEDAIRGLHGWCEKVTPAAA
jgi:UV DNA damage endonuclease